MKKLFLLALLGTMFIGVPVSTFAQGEDSVEVAVEEPTDTISIDNMEPVFYEDEATEESSNTMTYAIIGGVVVVAAGAFLMMRKKKK